MVKATGLGARTSLECGGGLKIAGDTVKRTVSVAEHKSKRRCPWGVTW
jgi:hypothetical protein